MSFLEKVPKHIETLDKEINQLSTDRYQIDWGHDCDCEYCDRDGDDADPEAETKAERIDMEIKARQQMIKRLERYKSMFEVEPRREPAEKE